MQECNLFFFGMIILRQVTLRIDCVDAERLYVHRREKKLRVCHMFVCVMRIALYTVSQKPVIALRKKCDALISVSTAATQQEFVSAVNTAFTTGCLVTS